MDTDLGEPEERPAEGVEPEDAGLFDVEDIPVEHGALRSADDRRR